MGSDAVTNARLPAFARDSAKKKKGSRLGKVKQKKVDVRREQWVSRVKNKGCKMESDALPSTSPKPIDRFKAQENLPMRAVGGDDHEFTTMSWASKEMGRSHYSSGKDFAQRTTRRRSSRSSFGSSEGGRDHEEGCLDSWEAMADALPSCTSDHRCSKSAVHRPEGTLKGRGGYVGTTRAWAPDDSFRPRSLPRVGTKKQVLMQNSEEPSACPICCEDFDITDSSFLPCPCGFRLCLFCHKRILEVDARCPGCRKEYDSVHADAGLQSESVMWLNHGT